MSFLLDLPTVNLSCFFSKKWTPWWFSTFFKLQAVKNNVSQFVYASSSSVYGLNKSVPFSEKDTIETCNSPYACSKRCMEVFANTYNQLYGISLIGLRFFTVYGPWGRPDMAPYKFLNAIQEGSKFNK